MSYLDFIRSKRANLPVSGLKEIPTLSPHLFSFQKSIVTWALTRGKAAVFADTGLGKTLMELEFARAVVEATKGKVIIFTPLAVAAQTIGIAHEFKTIVPKYCKDQSEVESGVTITNYDRLDNFDPREFTAVILDESSILKSVDGKTRTALIEKFHATPFKLAATATPAPNDHTEIGNHAEFLGVMSRVEMLAMHFTHDGGETSVWRLKGHAEREFWAWVSSWAIAIRKPSDLGFTDEGYNLPELEFVAKVIKTEQIAGGESLFSKEALGLLDQRRAKKSSVVARVEAVAQAVANEPNEPWMIWCETNDESELLGKAIQNAVQVRGSDTADHKEKSMLGFSNRKIQILISKPSICGFGMNWQHCARTAFVGVINSYEQFYQAIRRHHRFGQTRAVQVHLFYTDEEAAIFRNLQRKQADAERLADSMVAVMREENANGLKNIETTKTNYEPRRDFTIPAWL